MGGLKGYTKIHRESTKRHRENSAQNRSTFFLPVVSYELREPLRPL